MVVKVCVNCFLTVSYVKMDENPTEIVHGCLGHMLDPDELPGLAHFCEHMLFLGTKKVIFFKML